MWRRTDLKEKAKRVLKGNYWTAFFVSLIILITGGSHNRGEVGSGTGGAETGNVFNIDIEIALLIGAGILIIFFLRILIGYVLEVGGRKYFIKLSEGESRIAYLAHFFRANYVDVFLTMLLRSIYLILWTLLFIIPGIIKFYAYRMVPYILADNPEIGHKRAIELSSEMTRGEKWDIFVLDLSFLGWFILGAMILGVGIFFVQPYYDATNAELYLKLRQNAIANGITSSNELNISN